MGLFDEPYGRRRTPGGMVADLRADRATPAEHPMVSPIGHAS